MAKHDVNPAPILIALVGPTALGKTRISLNIAPQLRAEIVSVDSMQVYRGMDIGTDKPSPAERKRVPHHLVDLVSPCEPFTVAQYQELAFAAISDIHARGRLPLLVGGSGLYFQAVADTLNFPEYEAAETVRAKLEEEAARDPAALNARLEEVDPDSAAAVPAGNIRRVIRALEVWEITGIPYSRFQGQLFSGPGAFDIIAAGIEAERDLLTRLIHRRVQVMLKRGLLEEVQGLVQEGCLSRTAAQALGYRQILEFLDTPGELEETIRKIELGTRRLAKRQLTWFRRDPHIVWFKLEGDEESDLRRLEEDVLGHFRTELEKRER